jgi:hypothetical protein
MTLTVYCLCHPETGEVYYVGCTNNIVTRLAVHYYETGRFRDILRKKRNRMKSVPPDWRSFERPIDRKSVLILRYRLGLEAVVPKVMGTFDDMDAASVYEAKMIKRHKPPCNTSRVNYARGRKKFALPLEWQKPTKFKSVKRLAAHLGVPIG